MSKENSEIVCVCVWGGGGESHSERGSGMAYERLEMSSDFREKG